MTAPPADAGSPPPAPAAATLVFGDRLDLARRYAGLLATDGVVRGLIGPREAPRLWDRHLLNCALVADLLPAGARVVDVGTGAGLPGLVLAVRRPDLVVTLVEPMLRRTTFLEEAVRDLGLSDNVRVVRGRAEDAQVRAVVAPTHWAVARAVAPLARLVSWCLPLLARGGQLLAMKGATAEAEIAEFRATGDAVAAVDTVHIEADGVDPVRVVVVTAA